MPADKTTPELKYHLREDGIHEMVMLYSTHAAVAAVFAAFDAAVAQVPPDGMLLALLDVSRIQTLPSLRFLLQQAHEFEEAHPTTVKTRTALIYNASVIAQLAQTFLDLLPSVMSSRSQIRLFKVTHYDEAVAWLLDASLAK